MDTGFVRTTGEKQTLTGLQKAAILLGELGTDAGQDVIACLNLTPEEMKKIRRAMKTLGPYPRNMNDILREEAVLNETINFGKFKGIFHPIKKEDKQTRLVNENKNSVSQMLQDNPTAITNLIRSWLDD